MNSKITKCLLLLLSLAGPKLMAQPFYGHYLSKIAPSGNDVFVKSVAYDAAGNMYVAGQFNGSATFNNTTVLTTSVNAAFVAKINSHGQTVWAKQETGTITGSYDGANDIAVDGQGNVYITGDGSSGAMFGTYSPDNGTHPYTHGFFVKLDNSGNVIWAKGSNSMYPYALYVDNSNNVYLAGRISDDSTFLGGNYIPGDRGGQDAGFILKMDGTGGFLATFLTYSSTTITDIDGNGTNIVASGLYSDDLMFVNGVPIAGPTGGPGNSENGFVAKFNTSLASQWAKPSYCSYVNDYNSVATDAQGNVYLGGTYSDTLILDGAYKFIAPTATSHNHVLVKYDASGNIAWANSYGNGQSNNITLPRLAYSNITQKLWALFYAENGEVIGSNTINNNMAIADVSTVTGAITTLIQSTTDAAVYGAGLATWHNSVGVGGWYIQSTGPTGGNMTLLGLTNNYIFNYNSGFMFDFGAVPEYNKVANVSATAEDLLVFPNPSTGTVTIKAAGINEGTITVTNILGLVVSQQAFNASMQLNLGYLPKGTYILNVHTNDGTDISRKLVLE